MKISQHVKATTALRQAAPVGLELADILRKKYRTVNYDTKTGRGTVSMGELQATWQDSQNEDKIMLSISAKNLRAFSGQQAAQALFTLNAALKKFA